MEIAPLGDSALVVRVGNSRRDRLSFILAARARLEQAEIPGVLEIAPGFASVAVYYDPVRLAASIGVSQWAFDWLSARVGQVLDSLDELTVPPAETREIEIPVCFEADFGLDLNEVARHTGFAVKQIIDLYCEANYQVNCVGFTPGFPFLAGLPERLATPRRPTPRQQIPVGSVGIGGEQTGIYPVNSPGGWNIIGRTPLSLFDPTKFPPSLFRAGDRVHFRSISREEFDRLAK